MGFAPSIVYGSFATIGRGGAILGVARGIVIIYCRWGYDAFFVSFYGRNCGFVERVKIGIAHELIHGGGIKQVCGYTNGASALLFAT